MAGHDDYDGAPSPALDQTLSAAAAGPAGERLAPGVVLASRYRVVRFLAEGGMGAVYEVDDEALHERVALKTIRPAIARDPAAMARFRREIQLARRVTSPNVCRAFDLGIHGEGNGAITFLTMELLAGETLAHYVRRKGALPEAEALPIARQMISALGAAHEAKVVHRDFKGENVILLPREDGSLRAVVTDFGLARGGGGGAADNLTGAGAMVGSPATMAPEQVAGKEVGPAADVYSLGVVLFQMVTGRYPFAGPTPLAVASARLHTRPPAARSLARSLDPRWDAAIARCLEVEPAARFARVEELLEAIAPSSSGAFPSSPSVTDSAPARVGAAAVPVPRRRRLAIAAAIAATVLAVAIAAIVTTRGAPARGPAPPAWRGPGRPAIMVLRLADRSGDGWRGCALAAALRGALGAGGAIRVVGHRATSMAALDLDLADGDALDAPRLAALARHTPFDFAVAGTISDAGAELRLLDAATGATVATFAPTGADPAAWAADAAARVRAALALAPPPDGLAELARLYLPISDAATRHYCDALDAIGRYRLGDARAALERSIAEDGTFALAHAELADTFDELVDAGSDAVRERKVAHAFDGRFPDDVRLPIEAAALIDGGRYDEAVAAMRRAIEAAPDDVALRVTLGYLQLRADRPKDLFATVEEARRLPPPLGDDPAIDALESEARLGDPSAAVATARRGISRARARGARKRLAELQFFEAISLDREGHSRQAIAPALEAEAGFRALGHERWLAEAYVVLMMALTKSGQHAAAWQAMERHHEILERIGNRGHRFFRAHREGVLLAAMGKHARSRATCAEGLRNLRADRATEKRVLEALLLICGARADLALGDLRGARVKLEETFAIAKLLPDPVLVRVDALGVLTTVLGVEGRAEEARARLAEMAAAAHEAGMARAELAAELIVAGIELDDGRLAEAEAGARRVQSGAAALEVIDAEIRAWALLAWCLAARGDTAGALAAADRAETLARSSETVDVAIAATIAGAVAGAAGDQSALVDAQAAESVLLRAEADLARALAAGKPGSPARRAALAAFARDARRRGLAGLAQRAGRL